MNAPMAYLNVAGRTRSGKYDDSGLKLLNALLSSATNRTPVDQDSSKDEPASKSDIRSENSTHPGKFKNDPDDPENPNEARRRFIRKVDKHRNR